MITPKGIAIIKEFEGCKLTAYPDPATGGDPWTIGYGLTSAAGVMDVCKGLTITQEQAEECLQKSLAPYEDAVDKACTKKPTDTQRDAMVSLCYNIGPGNFKKSSVVRLHNAGDHKGAVTAFASWNKAAGKVMAGLTRRRKAEADLYEG